MNFSTAKVFAEILAALASAFISRLVAMSMEAYPKAFNHEAIRTKCAVGFMIGVGWIIRMCFWGTFSWPLAAVSLVAGPIVGGIFLTAAHFVGEILWTALTDLYSATLSLLTPKVVCHA